MVPRPWRHVLLVLSVSLTIATGEQLQPGGIAEAQDHHVPHARDLHTFHGAGCDVWDSGASSYITDPSLIGDGFAGMHSCAHALPPPHLSPEPLDTKWVYRFRV